MQSYKQYLQIEDSNSNAFERAYRETFLFQLINDVTKQIPDNARGESDFQVKPLPLDAKRRLRNQIYKQALIDAETEGKTVSDPDILVGAFAKTKIGKEYAQYISENWLTATGAQRQKYDTIIKAWTLDQTVGEGDAFVTTISPYDPMFSTADIFDEHDQVLYFNHPAGAGDLIDRAFVGKGREVLATQIGDDHMLASEVAMESELTASGYKILEHYIKDSKTRRSIKDVLLKQYHDAGDKPLSAKEINYMKQALEYLSGKGFDFNLRVDRGGKVCAYLTGSNIEIRLLDRDEPWHQGRIYDNGRVVYYGSNNANKGDDLSSDIANSITTADRMRLLAYYVGGDDVRVYVDKYAAEQKNFNGSAPYIGQLTARNPEVGGSVSRSVAVPRKSRESNVSIMAAIKPCVSLTKPWTRKDGSVVGTGVDDPDPKKRTRVTIPYTMLQQEYPDKTIPEIVAIISRNYGNKYDPTYPSGYLNDEMLNIMVSTSAVSMRENLPEYRFMTKMSFDKCFNATRATKDKVVPNPDMDHMLADNGTYSASFRSTFYENGDVCEYGVFSDINGNMYDPNGTVPPKYPEYAADLTVVDGKLSFVEDIPAEHRNLYGALVVRNTLAEWVDDAKQNFMKQVDVDSIVAAYENNYAADSDYVYPFSDDELVSEYQKLYWSILTNTYTKPLSGVAVLDDDGNAVLDEDGNYVSVYATDMPFEQKVSYLQGHLHTSVDFELFGDVPMINVDAATMSKEPVYISGYENVEEAPHGFNPENMIKYCQAEDISQRRRQDCLLHMLDKLQGYGYSDAECSWVGSDSYTASVLRDNLVEFDATPNGVYPLTLSYRDIFNSPDIYQSPDEALAHNKMLSLDARRTLETLKNYPVRAEMMFHTLKELGESGADPGSINVTIDHNGIMRYEADSFDKKQLERPGAKGRIKTTGGMQTSHLEGYIGQIFEPDEHGAIHTQYASNNAKVLVPGYQAMLVPNDPENPIPARDRLRLTSWQQSMKHAITREIRRAMFTVESEYSFVPHTATLNTVYRHMYDMTIDAEDYKRMLAEKDPAQLQTNLNIIETLAGRCRFSNELADGASTMAQSYLENPTMKEAQRFDYYYSDLYDNENIRVLSDQFDGIFDRDMTGTAKTAGAVRYLVKGAKVSSVDGTVTAAGKDAVCPLMDDELFARRTLDTWDRRQMASSQALTALHTPRHVGAAMLNIKGWNFDDGFIVTRKFAEANKIKDMLRYEEYAERHNGKQPPQELVDIESVKSLLVRTDSLGRELTEEEWIKLAYDEENHVLRKEYVNDPWNPSACLASLYDENGDYPFEYYPGFGSFEEQAARAVQRGHDCEDMLRPLITQDKLSDMHGNKGVISRVIDPEFTTANLLAKEIVPGPAVIVVDEDGTVRTHDGDVIYGRQPVVDSNGNTVRDGNNAIVYEWVLDARYIADPADENRVLFNPYRADGNYSFDLDLKGIDDPEARKEAFEKQAVYAIQKAFGMHDMDDVLQVFADNPNLDVAMAPYSGMGRFNGGTVMELMSSADDLVLNGQTIEGGMGYLNMIVVDMPADVKTHWYGPEQVAEGKGRKSSGQLSWILQSKHCHAISELFYGNNQSAVDKLREYMIAVGLDFDNELKPIDGYKPMFGEKRVLTPMDDIESYFKDDAVPFKTKTTGGVRSIVGKKGDVLLDGSVIAAHRADMIRKLNEHGGFMELPFQLDFKTGERAGRFLGKDGKHSFLTQRTNRTYTVNTLTEQADGTYASREVARPTFGLPVLPPNLRAGQEFVDGTMRAHDYTEKYVDIHAQGLLYSACEYQLGVETDAQVREALKRQMAACKASAQAILDTLTTDIIEKRFDNKHNIIRDDVMATRVNVSGTAVWSEDPRLDLDQVAMSSEHAKLLGIMNDAGELLPKGDCRVLVWRDPILHDGGVRFLKVTIDDTIRGISVNPLIDKSFDGDFDGDSIAVVPLQVGKKTKDNTKQSAAQNEAYNAFSLEANLLDMGSVIDKDGPLKGMHPLYIQDGLDVKSNLDTKDPNISDEERARRQAINDKFVEITIKVNELEAQFKRDPKSVTAVGARGRNYTGESALRIQRKALLAELNDWAHSALDGIATDHIVVHDKETVMQSMQHIATNGAKGNVKKMADYANNLGITYEKDADGNYVAGSAKWIAGKGTAEYVDGKIVGSFETSDTIDFDNVISAHTALGVQRLIDNAIQETAAYKADNTSLGGMQSQKGVAALRNQALTAVTRLTYPTTQAILQSKHDPADAKSKDFIVRYWGADVWNGYKLTGNFTGEPEFEGDTRSPEEIIQQSRHEVILEPVLDSHGEPIPKKVHNDATDEWEPMMKENPLTGELEPVYEMTPKKCTREEWIQQMLGMEMALKVDINPAFIEELADIMEYHGAHQVYNEDGKPMYDPDSRNKTPIMTHDSTIAGLGTFAAENGTLLDKMAYNTGRFSSLFDEALKPDAEKQSIITGSDTYAKDITAVQKEEYDASNKAAQTTHRAKVDATKKSRPESSFFLPFQSREAAAGHSTKKVKDAEGNVTYEEVDPTPIGSKKSQMSEDITSGETYMGETLEQFKLRVGMAEPVPVQPATKKAATKAAIAQQTQDVVDSTVPKASPEAASSRKKTKDSKGTVANETLGIADLKETDAPTAARTNPAE